MKFSGKGICKACHKELTANLGGRCNECLERNRPIVPEPKHTIGRLCTPGKRPSGTNGERAAGDE